MGNFLKASKLTFEFTVAVKQVEPQHALDVSLLLGEALAKINLAVRQSAEMDLEAKEHPLSIVDCKDDLFRQALLGRVVCRECPGGSGKGD